jgi:hypothetical protein
LGGISRKALAGEAREVGSYGHRKPVGHLG